MARSRAERRSPASCCEPNDTPYCNDETCCDAVCKVNPSCCEDEWDQSCADLAWQLCDHLDECQPPQCGDSGTGGCCSVSDTPHCANTACCESVCAELPHCCETSWDEACATLAANICGSASNCDPIDCQWHCGGTAPGNCWCDDLCVAFRDCCPQACVECPDLSGCDPADGHCIGWCAHLNVNGCGCDILACDEWVCCDEFCWCEQEWGYVFPSPPGPCPLKVKGDLTGDGMVNGADLLILLSNWGECSLREPIKPCAGDLNWDRVVDGQDLLILLENWGPEPGECAETDSCGDQAPSGCWCDEFCCDFEDCCPRKFEDCRGCIPCSE